MTIENWEKLDQQGYVTDATCFPAAVDCVSLRHDIPPHLYQRNQELFELSLDQDVRHQDLARLNKEYYNKLFKAAGAKSYIDKRAQTPDQTEKLLRNAKQGGWRVIMYTSSFHVVGLRPVRDGWKMVGNDTPIPPDIVLMPNQIYPLLDQPPRETVGRKRKLENFTLLSPEKRTT